MDDVTWRAELYPLLLRLIELLESIETTVKKIERDIPAPDYGS